MSQGTEHWSPLHQSCVPVGYDAGDENPMQVWPHNPIAVPYGQYPTSPLDDLLKSYTQYLTNPDELPYLPDAISYTNPQIPGATHPDMKEDQDDTGLDPSSLLSQESENKFADQFYHQLYSQLGNHPPPLHIPDYGTAGPLTSSTISDASLPSPDEHCVAEDFSSQELPGIKNADATYQPLLSFDEEEHPQLDNVLHMSARVAAPLPASWSMDELSLQSLVSSTSELSTIELKAMEEDMKTVGSAQIQHAAGKRRKKDGVYQCPFRTCNATFTARHNARYHIFAHFGVKPYKCGKLNCDYAASSPATTKRHRSTCKGTSRSTAGNM